jgi:hypothetical protein
MFPVERLVHRGLLYEDHVCKQIDEKSCYAARPSRFTSAHDPSAQFHPLFHHNSGGRSAPIVEISWVFPKDSYPQILAGSRETAVILGQSRHSRAVPTVLDVSRSFSVSSRRLVCITTSGSLMARGRVGEWKRVIPPG